MTKVKLGEMLTLKKGKKAELVDIETDKSQRYIQIDDLRNDDNLKFTESQNMTQVSSEDILLAWDGANAGTVGYGLMGAIGSTITALKLSTNYSSKVLSEYLGAFLESKSQFLRDRATGATIPHLNKTVLLGLELPILSIATQKTVIRSLNEVKRLITLRQVQLKQFDELVKSRFNEMFGDCFENPQNKLSTFISLNPNKSEVQKTIGKVSFIPMANVSEDGRLDLSNIREINDVYTGFTYFKNDDVIIAKITPCFENGKGAVLKKLVNGIGFGSTEFHVLRPSKDINSVWLYHVTMLPQFRLEGERKMTGSGGQRRIPKDFIKNFKLNLPPLSLQNEFAAFVEEVDKSKFICLKCKQYVEEIAKIQYNRISFRKVEGYDGEF